MKFTLATAAVLLAGNAAAAPTAVPAVAARSDPPTAADIIVTIAPHVAKTPDECTQKECADKDKVASLFIKAFSDYKIDNAGQMAAILALSALESVSFQWRHNLAGNNGPGQGTSNMQSAAFNKQYALSLPDVKDKVTNDPTANLALVTTDEHNFGSGAWFLTTQCSEEIREGLKSGTDAAFEAYIVECVDTSMSDERRAFWNNAKKAFNL
ncbi:hypothetical protein F4780DRAFT_337543 [Xylariomycetidae sp. FL0641]|nr:hypothetical protein F4780DRAFT_337543 [Xylariomycetidae sp. FL0641]